MPNVRHDIKGHLTDRQASLPPSFLPSLLPSFLGRSTFGAISHWPAIERASEMKEGDIRIGI